ncbi:MAG: hypothetical protein HDS26_04310 [Bacteroides sp.]|nr:hypothetical protein [Bacteroides sp.]
MAYRTNNEKLLQAVLSNERLMKFGNYTHADIGSLYVALSSENYVINTVAQIIKRTDEGASERELWKEINDYLKRNV